MYDASHNLPHLRWKFDKMPDRKCSGLSWITELFWRVLRGQSLSKRRLEECFHYVFVNLSAWEVTGAILRLWTKVDKRFFLGIVEESPPTEWQYYYKFLVASSVASRSSTVWCLSLMLWTIFILVINSLKITWSINSESTFPIFEAAIANGVVSLFN